MWSTRSAVCASTVRSHEPNVGISWLELPATTSSTSGSMKRMRRAVSAAIRPYSSAVLWPICHGPSISLPRHQTRMPNGASLPFERRSSLRAVPPGWFVYSSSCAASAGPRVPRLTASMTSRPTLSAQVGELVESDGVGFGAVPRGIQAHGALVAGADAIFPAVTRDEVAAGVAHDRRTEALHQIADIAAESVGVGGGVRRARRCRRRRSVPCVRRTSRRCGATRSRPRRRDRTRSSPCWPWEGNSLMKGRGGCCRFVCPEGGGGTADRHPAPTTGGAYSLTVKPWSLP